MGSKAILNPTEEEESTSRRWRRAGLFAAEMSAVVLSLWILAAALQWRAGAFNAEFGSHSDEASHYMTGLMIRDYVASGNFRHPWDFAINYYAHYPKIAFGMWPPFFHSVEALWMLAFSPSRVSVLLFMALLAAAVGASIYRVLRDGCPRLLAFVGGAVFILLPLTQISTYAVMADSLVALLDFWALVYLIRYVKEERTGDAILFGLVASMALSTKANALVLVLLPLALILITRRFYLLRRPGVYYSLGIMLLLGGPWQVISYRLIQHSAGAPLHTYLIAPTAAAWVPMLAKAIGYALAPFCVLETIVLLLSAWRNRSRMDVTLAGVLALVLCVWIFHSAIAQQDRRYALAALPPMLILAVAGFQWVARRIPLGSASIPVRMAALGILVAIVSAAQTWVIPQKRHLGLDEAAQVVESSPEYSRGGLLVVSDERGEGSFVSEIAMRDNRPGHLVLRSTKVLGSSSWFGHDFQPKFDNMQALREFLDKAPVEAVVLDTRPLGVRETGEVGALARMVSDAVQSDPNWHSGAWFPQSSEGHPWIHLYSRVGPVPVGSMQLDLRFTLGKDIFYSHDGKNTQETIHQ
jgi:hypothetical protein